MTLANESVVNNHTVTHVGQVSGEKYDGIRKGRGQDSGKNCENLFAYLKLRVYSEYILLR